ncbi:Uma2 family endonuclease [Streptomyces rimosus]|uniref:Uma2 family endonuclease n=1 Tax=Streptomyces TaxID=1883 RepID=UPI00051887EA|nr:Uma2 family endonuclease [Streptomyces rimosus]
MSALTVDHEPDSDWETLLRLWEETEGPEGSKVEIIEGIVTVSPAPANRHNKIAWKLQRALTGALPEDWGMYQTVGVSVPSRMGLYIPDLVVAPEAALDEPGNFIPGAAAELIVEITSPTNACQDRISKAAGYARAGVPLYLLVDVWAPESPTVTLFGEPKRDVYQVLQAVKFGEEIRLPEPFDVVIETAGFPGKE